MSFLTFKDPPRTEPLRIVFFKCGLSKIGYAAQLAEIVAAIKQRPPRVHYHICLSSSPGIDVLMDPHLAPKDVPARAVKYAAEMGPGFDFQDQVPDELLSMHNEGKLALFSRLVVKGLPTADPPRRAAPKRRSVPSSQSVARHRGSVPASAPPHSRSVAKRAAPGPTAEAPQTKRSRLQSGSDEPAPSSDSDEDPLQAAQREIASLRGQLALATTCAEQELLRQRDDLRAELRRERKAHRQSVRKCEEQMEDVREEAHSEHMMTLMCLLYAWNNANHSWRLRLKSIDW